MPLLTPEMDILLHAIALDAVIGADLAEGVGGTVQIHSHRGQRRDNGEDGSIGVRGFPNIELYAVGHDADKRLVALVLDSRGRLQFVATSRCV